MTVAMLTFNHEQFIAQSISSVLAQRLACAWRLVVGDDASSDRTVEIIRELAVGAPIPVEIHTQSCNVGFFENMRAVLDRCDSEYIAFLEGDDYWLCPDKLQRQIDLLDHNPEISLSCHCADSVDASGVVGVALPRNPPDDGQLFSAADVMRENFVVTGSVVLRRTALSGVPGWARRLKMLDRPMWITALQHGSGHFSRLRHSAYRWHSGGLWGGTPRESRILAELEFYSAAEQAMGELAPYVAEGRQLLIGRLVREIDELSIRLRKAENPPWQHLIRIILARLKRGFLRRFHQ